MTGERDEASMFVLDGIFLLRLLRRCPLSVYNTRPLLFFLARRMVTIRGKTKDNGSVQRAQMNLEAD